MKRAILLVVILATVAGCGVSTRGHHSYSVEWAIRHEGYRLDQEPKGEGVQ